MNEYCIHFIWHIHQPFFVSDEELRARIGTTYAPLLNEFVSRRIPFSLNITGATLSRLRSIDPSFVDWLATCAAENNISLLGSVAHHAFIAWLSLPSLRAQLLVDQQEKSLVGLPSVSVLLPTDLSWSYRIGLAAHDLGYENVIVNSDIRMALNTVPQWNSINGSLLPSPKFSAPAGTTSTLKLALHEDAFIRLLIHENMLANRLREDMFNDDISTKEILQRFIGAINAISFHRLTSGDAIFVSEDVERFIPSKFSRFLDFLDQAQDADVPFISLNDALERSASRDVTYAPACSVQGDDAMWTHSPDDIWYRAHLERTSDQLARFIDLEKPRNEKERNLRDKLLSIQDSSFYYWHFIPRSRAQFQIRLMELEKCLHELSSNSGS